jgi:hypothetical protein
MASGDTKSPETQGESKTLEACWICGTPTACRDVLKMPWCGCCFEPNECVPTTCKHTTGHYFRDGKWYPRVPSAARPSLPEEARALMHGREEAGVISDALITRIRQLDESYAPRYQKRPSRSRGKTAL